MGTRIFLIFIIRYFESCINIRPHGDPAPVSYTHLLNITLVLSTAAMVSSSKNLPLVRTQTGFFAGQNQLLLLDIPVALAVCLILIAVAWNKKLVRLHGVILLGIYGAYLTVLLLTMG